MQYEIEANAHLHFSVLNTPELCITEGIELTLLITDIQRAYGDDGVYYTVYGEAIAVGDGALRGDDTSHTKQNGQVDGGRVWFFSSKTDTRKARGLPDVIFKRDRQGIKL